MSNTQWNRLLFGHENNQNVKHFKVRHVEIESGPKSTVSWHVVSIAPAKTCPHSTLLQRFRAKNSITFRSEVLYVHHVTCRKKPAICPTRFVHQLTWLKTLRSLCFQCTLFSELNLQFCCFLDDFFPWVKKVKMSEWTTSTIDKTKQTEPLGFKIAGHSQVRECRIMSNLRFTSPYPTPRRK